MNYNDARKERRELKQKLFLIRRFTEGEKIILSDEILELKNKFESNPSFSSWLDFPEKWDIGDPYGVKKDSFTFNEVDRNNFNKMEGKGLSEIITLKNK